MTATAALAAVIDDLAVVVDSLSDAQYADSGVPGLSGSVGGHVRHCLDHVRALERAITTGMVDYEVRERDTRVEIDRTLAWSLLVSARRRVGSIPESAGARPVVVRTRLDVGTSPVEVLSSLEREISFVIAHTIHHCATIACWRASRANGCPIGSASRRARLRQREELYVHAERSLFV